MGNLETWLHGLVAAFIGGGASAVTAGIAAPAINPQAFNFHDQIAPLFQLMGVLFLVNGLLAAFAYLKQSPLPSMETTTTVKTVAPVGDAVVTKSVTTKESQ
jgi:hypothetical protein